MEGKDKEDNDQRQQTNRTTTLTTENEPTTTPTSENKPPKYKTDAEPECDKVKTDTEQEAHSDLDQDETVIEIGEAAEEADTSMESTLESTMETDSQIESQNEEKSTTETGRKTRKCKQWTPGSYAALHKGHQKEKKEKKQTKQDEQKSQKRIILHLENERQKNKKKITELEAEIDILAAQIEENDHSTGLNDQQSREIAELKTKIHLIQERENEHLSEINSLQQKVDQLEKDNDKLIQENRNLKMRISEATKQKKKLEQTAQAAVNEKEILEQVANEKTQEISRLQNKLERMENRQEDQSQPPEEKPPVILIGDSNCRDIQGHLMIWLNQPIKNQRAPTLTDAKAWALDNCTRLQDTTVVLLCGTNDLKTGSTRQTVSALHKEVTQIITDAGANLVVTQLPPVYHPLSRAEHRNRETDLLNEVLLERHNDAVATTDAISLHRGQMNRDGLHITNESAEIMAENITSVIQAQRTQPVATGNIRITIPNDDHENRISQQEFTTTRQIAAKAIGKGGDRIRRIKDLYQVEINTKETGDDERKFIITGAAKDTEKVLKVIKDIAKDTEDYDREQESRSQYTNAPKPHTSTKKIPVNCRFFARGKCKRGNACQFEHTHGPSDAPEGSESTVTSSESEEREPTPVRKVTLKKKPQEPRNRNKDSRCEQRSNKAKKKRHTQTTDENETDTESEDSTNRPPSSRGRSRHRTNTPSPQGARQTKSQKTSQTRGKSKRPSSRGRTRHHTRTPSPQDRRKNKQKSTENREKPYKRQQGETSLQSSSRDPSRSRSDRRTSPSWDRSGRRNRTPSPAGANWYDTSRRSSPSPWRQSHHDQDRQRYYRRDDWSPPRRSRSRSAHRHRTNRHRSQERNRENELARAIDAIFGRSSRR